MSAPGPRLPLTVLDEHGFRSDNSDATARRPMTDDKTASAGPTAGFDQRRRYPPPTIDLTATEVAAAHSDASPTGGAAQ